MFQKQILSIGLFCLFWAGFPPALQAREDSDPAVASQLQILERRAAAGNVKAQTALGYLYWHGVEVPQDYEKAVYWIEKAANQGDAGAQDGLGLAYASGMGDKNVDYAKAKELFEKAARQGDPSAQTHLARLHLRGAGVNKNYQLAKYWLDKAVSQQNNEGECLLSLMYVHGDGVEKNMEIAADLRHKSCEHGYQTCCKPDVQEYLEAHKK